ncbi:chromosome segregation protein Spc25-domain-containing protein [Phycomyces blakesleeanus]|uniref:Kinetochore protein SPC25 n=1 Tax=Phycomyces blakesleeanus TaxID=4837 RepID=A0ABR3B7B5_PHYBL
MDLDDIFDPITVRQQQDTLTARIFKAKERVNFYLKDEKKRMTQEEKAAIEINQQLKDDQIAMRNKMQECKEKIDSYKQKLPLSEEKLRFLTRQVNEYQNKEEEIMARKDKYQVDCDLLRKKIRAKKNEQQSKQGDLNNKKRLNMLELDICKKYTQMTCTSPKTNHIKFSFQFIDPHNLEAVYSFTLYTSPDQLYQLVECSPEVTKSADLVQQLNKDRDLYGFIKRMRKEFCSLADNI